MLDYSERINPTKHGISWFLESLLSKRYQIPTFQREVVWERDAVKKLWDSIFRFYPIGSLLIWKTDLKLQNHRWVGGYEITDEVDRPEYQYILDGQQRTTALLTALYGGKIEGKENFDPTLHIDLTVVDQQEIDDQSYKQRFLFWDEIDDKNGTFAINSQRMGKHRDGLIVPLMEIKRNFWSIEAKLQGKYPDFNHPVRENSRIIQNAMGNYLLSFIELKGIDVSEVCQIFERINQAGKPLDIFDIVVAKTFRPDGTGRKGFYLRQLIDDFRASTPGNFSGLDNLTYLQILSMIVYHHVDNSGVLNITPIYLNRLRTEHIETVWDGAKAALLKMFNFFENYLHLKGPRLIPYRYFYIALAVYFYNNPQPEYGTLKQYFWYICFHRDDLLSNTTQLRQCIDVLQILRKSGQLQVQPFWVDRQRLRKTYYSAQSSMATSMLALYANQEPRSWTDWDLHVLNEVYYILAERPNLHHFFPVNFMAGNPGKNKQPVDSMANIAYLTQLENIKISDKNPITYLRNFDKPGFEAILKGHLVPLDVLEWTRAEKLPENALDMFIEKRIDLIIETLREKLAGISFHVTDSQETASNFSS